MGQKLSNDLPYTTHEALGESTALFWIWLGEKSRKQLKSVNADRWLCGKTTGLHYFINRVEKFPNKRLLQGALIDDQESLYDDYSVFPVHLYLTSPSFFQKGG